MKSTESSTDLPAAVSRARHRWFPTLVLLAAGSWWLRQSLNAGYHTFFHVLVAGASIAILSLWYVRYGGGPKRRRQVLVGGVWLAIVGFLMLFRPVYNGDMGVYGWRLRYANDPDERLGAIASAGDARDWQTTPQDYPRFLGNGHWAEVMGVELETDWKSQPPVEVWRRPIGAGWSAFSVAGRYAVTQEQRGTQELVTCYRLDTGEPVWVHADAARFDPAGVAEGLGGVGPRATPTIHGSRIFTMGATGIVHCLDAVTGQSLWSHDVPAKFGTAVPPWGKSCSPLVVGDMVVVSAGAPAPAVAANSDGPAADQLRIDTPGETSLVAFDVETGSVRWAAGSRKSSYASPVLAELAGERQVLIANESYVTAHRAADGAVLWEHPWGDANDQTASASQPIPLPGDRVFLSKGYGVGASLLSVARKPDGAYFVQPLWRPAVKRVMKTKLCNVVVRDGYVYGLDDVLLECIDLETGDIRWKKRRSPEFGHGQIMLIGGVILVLSETGELALVEASPERYIELASIRVLDDAYVTWNNPAFAPPYLVVRNGHEAACFRLPMRE